jgi:hypothetical protein
MLIGKYPYDHIQRWIAGPIDALVRHTCTCSWTCSGIEALYGAEALEMDEEGQLSGLVIKVRDVNQRTAKRGFSGRFCG